MASTDLSSLRKRATYGRLAAQKAEIEQSLLSLDQEKAELAKAVAENGSRITKLEAQYDQTCLEITDLQMPADEQIRTPMITPTTTSSKPVRPTFIDACTQPAPTASARSSTKSPKHMEEIHSNYRMILYEADQPGRKHSTGEWKLFSCGRCGANAMPRDGRTRFFSGTRGMAVHFRKQCRRSHESTFTEQEIMRMCFRTVIPSMVAERLRRGENVPGAAPMITKPASAWRPKDGNAGVTESRPSSPEIHVSESHLPRYELPKPASPPRWLQLDNNLAQIHERGRDGTVKQKRRRTVDGDTDAGGSGSDNDEWMPYKRTAQVRNSLQ